MKKNILNVINKIQEIDEVRRDKPEFEIVVKQDGKVVYHNKAFAGVVNFVQSVDSFKNGIMEGDSQAFGFGHPLTQLFAFDQLKQKVLPKLMKILQDLYDTETA